jgi:hypothetical protein
MFGIPSMFIEWRGGGLDPARGRSASGANARKEN